MRPAEPISRRRTRDFFIVGSILYAVVSAVLSGVHTRDRQYRRCCAEAAHATVPLRSSIRFEFLERFAQVCLVRLAHLAQWQANVARHCAAPAEGRLHRNRVWLDE